MAYGTPFKTTTSEISGWTFGTDTTGFFYSGGYGTEKPKTLKELITEYSEESISSQSKQHNCIKQGLNTILKIASLTKKSIIIESHLLKFTFIGQIIHYKSQKHRRKNKGKFYTIEQCIPLFDINSMEEMLNDVIELLKNELQITQKNNQTIKSISEIIDGVSDMSGIDEHQKGFCPYCGNHIDWKVYSDNNNKEIMELTKQNQELKQAINKLESKNELHEITEQEVKTERNNLRKEVETSRTTIENLIHDKQDLEHQLQEKQKKIEEFKKIVNPLSNLNNFSSITNSNDYYVYLDQKNNVKKIEKNPNSGHICKKCTNCKFEKLTMYDSPCNHCNGYGAWEQADK